MIMSKKKLILYILGSTIFILITVTFAYFTPKIINEHIFSTSGQADPTSIENYITLTTEKDNIDLSETYPMSESASLDAIDPYYFRISNNSNTNAVEYRIILEVSEDSTINDGFIQTSLGALNGVIDATTEGYNRAYIIHTGSLVAKEAQNFGLRIWIKETANDADILNKSWKAKLVVKSTIKEESSKLKVLTGDLNTPGSELKIGSEHFYLISNNNGLIRMITKYNLLIGNTSSYDYTSIDTTGTSVHVEESINPNEFNYGRQDSRALGINHNLSNGMIVTYYGLMQFSDEEHVVNQGMCDNEGVSSPCYTNYLGSKIKEVVDNYASMLSSETNMNLTGDLISMDELINLGCSINSCPEELSWLAGKEYYLKTALNSNEVYGMQYSEGLVASNYDTLKGCSPVIELNLNNL